MENSLSFYGKQQIVEEVKSDCPKTIVVKSDKIYGDDEDVVENKSCSKKWLPPD